MSTHSITGNIGSAPGTLAPKDWKKWWKAVAYLVGSAAVAGGLNEALDVVANIDFSTFTLELPLGIKVTGMQIGMGLTNLIAYLIELTAKDSRK